MSPSIKNDIQQVNAVSTRNRLHSSLYKNFKYTILWSLNYALDWYYNMRKSQETNYVRIYQWNHKITNMSLICGQWYVRYTNSDSLMNYNSKPEKSHDLIYNLSLRTTFSTIFSTIFSTNHVNLPSTGSLCNYQ